MVGIRSVVVGVGGLDWDAAGRTCWGDGNVLSVIERGNFGFPRAGANLYRGLSCPSQV